MTAMLISVNVAQCTIDYDRPEKDKVAVATVTDGNTVIFTTNPIRFEEDKARYDAQVSPCSGSCLAQQGQLPQLGRCFGILGLTKNQNTSAIEMQKPG